MRGTPHVTIAKNYIGGIIPAYAGNTRVRLRQFQHERDHPRVCGEHSSVGTNGVRALGSSPRMRGTHLTTDILTSC